MEYAEYFCNTLLTGVGGYEDVFDIFGFRSCELKVAGLVGSFCAGVQREFCENPAEWNCCCTFIFVPPLTDFSNELAMIELSEG